jgi:thioredoxin reductase (NADPH)
VALSDTSQHDTDHDATVRDDTVHEVIIIGSGPAGYTAAVYAARAQLAPVVFEGTQFGGALMNTTEVENYPGFAEGVMGPDLMTTMREQAERFGAQLRTEDVESVELTGEIKSVVAHGVTHRARAVVLAMGAAARYLGVPGESELLGRGVSSCATCDGFFFRGQDIAVVGGGDSAMEEATFLSRFARSVTLLHRRDEFRASRIMLDRARKDPKITFRTGVVVDEVVGEKSVTGLRLRDAATGEASTLPVTGLFVAIGHDPRSGLVRGQVDLDDEGYVRTGAPTTLTNLPGVFAAGDLVDHTYRQAVTAAGSGCSAAIDAERWLAEQGSSDTAETVPELVGGGYGSAG